MQVDKIWGRSHLSPFTNLPAGWTLPQVPGVTLGQVISPLTVGGAIPELYFINANENNGRHLAVDWILAPGLPTYPQYPALCSAFRGGGSLTRTSPKSPCVRWLLGAVTLLAWFTYKGPQHSPQLLGGCSFSLTLGNLHHLLAARVPGGELNKDAHCCQQNNDSLSPFNSRLAGHCTP